MNTTDHQEAADRRSTVPTRPLPEGPKKKGNEFANTRVTAYKATIPEKPQSNNNTSNNGKINNILNACVYP